MHILFISRWFPYPPDNGSKIRVFNLIKHLSSRHEVTLASFTQESVSLARLAMLAPYCRAVHTVLYRGFNPTRLKALLGFFSTRPRSILDTYSQEMQALIEKISAGERFDVVVASEIESTPYALLLSHAPRVFEELEMAVIHDQFANQHVPVSRVRYGLTWWKLARHVTHLLRQFAGCTVVSSQECDLAMQVAPEYDGLAIVPNGVDLEANTGNFGAPSPDTLIYSGALTYDANFDAMRFFVRDIFPLIKSQRPQARLRITGRYDGVPVEQLPPGDGVELTGYLDDVRPAVARSRVCVVPLRVGGGTRLKVLEAMALGTPIVSTSKGAEGLAVIHDEHVLIADEPGDFAQAVCRLLEDDRLRARLSANARRLVEEQYSWRMCARQLEQLLYRVAERTR